MVWDVGDLIRIAELLQSQLARVGVTLDIDVWEFSGFIGATAEGAMDMYYLTWSNSTGDADIALSSQFTCEQVGSRNRSRYCSESYDALAAAQYSEMDPNARTDKISEALHHLVADAPWVWLGSQEWIVGVNDRVLGYEIHPSGNFYIFDVTKQ
jgi:peptide/nickel transport system substrate-binding protein